MKYKKLLIFIFVLAFSFGSAFADTKALAEHTEKSINFTENVQSTTVSEISEITKEAALAVEKQEENTTQIAEKISEITNKTHADDLKKMESNNSAEQLQMINEIQQSIKVGNPIDLTGAAEEKSTTVVQGSVEATRNMSLEECIKLALLNNPSIQAAMSDRDVYKTKIGQAWSKYFPQLSVGASYTRNRMMMTTFKVPDPVYDLYNLPSLEVNQLVYDFGKTRQATNIAKKTFEASENNLQTSINDTIYSVKEAYYNLLFAYQQEQVYADTVANYEAHLEQAKNYYDIGTKAKIDVITAEYNLGNAKLNHIKSKHNIEVAYAKLNNAMGLPEYSNYDVDKNFSLPTFELDFNTLINKAYETRPELQAAKNKAEASNILTKAAKFAFMPDFRVYGSYASGGVSVSDTYSYQLGGGLQYQTVNLYQLKKQVDEAKATYKRDLAQYEEAKQNVHLDVKSAFINFNNAKDSIPVAKLSLLAAKEQHSLASGRYKTGLSDAIELKDAEITFLNAQLAYYDSLLNYNVALANLERVVGGSISDIETTLPTQEL